MVGTFLIQEQVRGGRSVLALGHLLQIALVIGSAMTARGVVDFGSNMTLDKFACRLDSTIEVDRPDQASNTSASTDAGRLGVRAHSLTDDQKLLQAEFSRDLCTSMTRHDDDRFNLGQIAFEIVGKLPKKGLADDRPENRIAEEFEPLIRGQTMIGA